MSNVKSTPRLLPFSFSPKTAFGFYLSAFTFLLSAVIAACSFNPAIQGKGETYLQGEWQQDSSAVNKQLVTWSVYKLKFNCDSFYITINTTSKVNYGADTCMNKGRWTEYIKGRYQQENDTLHLQGFFCNANGSLKELNTCFRSGVYDERIGIKKQTDSLIQFSGKSFDLPVDGKLLKRTSCTPRALQQ